MIDRICAALIGALLTALFAWLTHVRNAVSRKEMNFSIDRATGSFMSMLRANQTILAAMQTDMIQLKIDVAVIKKNGAAKGQHS